MPAKKAAPQINLSNLLQKVGEWTPKSFSDPQRFYFRGETTFGRPLVPSLLRKETFERLSKLYKTKDRIELQQKLLRRYSRYTSHLYHAESDFHGRTFTDTEHLCLAQHNGLPTLLTDWSLNPLVSLYFALSKGDGTPSLKGDSCFYVMKLKDKRRRDDQTIHLEDPRSEWEAREKTKRFCPLVVVPLVFTRRISAQSGRFIYAAYLENHESCLYESRSHSNAPWDSIDRYVILQKDKESLLERVRTLGIHEGRMFPDMGGWAKYLTNGGL